MSSLAWNVWYFSKYTSQQIVEIIDPKYISFKEMLMTINLYGAKMKDYELIQ